MAKPHPGRRHGTDWVPIDQPARPTTETKPAAAPEPIEATPLTEKPTFAQCDEAIKRSYIVQGKALRYVRDLKLYREAGFKTFEECCQARWDFTRQRAHDLIHAAEVALGLSTMVDKIPAPERPTLPANERQARELGKYPEDRRPEIMRLAAEAGGGKATAATIVQAGTLLELGEPAKVEPETILAVSAHSDDGVRYAKCDGCGIELGTAASLAGSSMIEGDLLCAKCVTGPVPSDVWPDGGHVPCAPDDQVTVFIPTVQVPDTPEPTSMICPTCHGKGAISRQKSEALNA